jgi:hypothetical protein
MPQVRFRARQKFLGVTCHIIQWGSVMGLVSSDNCCANIWEASLWNYVMSVAARGYVHIEQHYHNDSLVGCKSFNLNRPIMLFATSA